MSGLVAPRSVYSPEQLEALLGVLERHPERWRDLVRRPSDKPQAEHLIDLPHLSVWVITWPHGRQPKHAGGAMRVVGREPTVTLHASVPED